MKHILLTIVCCIGMVNHAAGQNSAESAVDQVLSNFHLYASQGDWNPYFALMSEDAIFLGTDAGERWTKSEFEGFARATSGWTYAKTARHIKLLPDSETAWFDELLWNDSYGECRGSGVLVKQDGQWLIAQYNLSIPIPNALARQITDLIKQQP